MLHPERFTAESLAMLLATVAVGVTLPVFASAPGQEPVVLGQAYRAPHAWYVIGAKFKFHGRSLRYVCESFGRENYNVGEQLPDRIYCLPTLEKAAEKLSQLILKAELVSS